MRTCFVPFCDVKHKDQPNRTMFLAPKERKLFAQWSDALPKLREFKRTDKVCYLHFKPDEVLNTFDHFINGNIIKIKRDRPRLKPNAIPCLQMSSNEEEWLSPRGIKKGTSVTNQSKNVKKVSDKNEKKFQLNINIGEPQEANMDPVNIYVEVENEEDEELKEICTEIVKEKNIVTDFEDQAETTTETGTETETFGSHIKVGPAKEAQNDGTRRPPPANNTTTSQLTNLFNFLYDNVAEILLPNTLWGTHRCPQRSFICFSCVDILRMQAIKMLIIKDDGSLQLFIAGNVKILNLLRVIEDLDSLSVLLNKMEVGQLCFGNATNVNCDFIVEPNAENCWFTEDNVQVVLCKFCLPQN